MIAALDWLQEAEFPSLFVPVVGDAMTEAFERESVGDVAVHDGADDVGREVDHLQAVEEEDVLHPRLPREVGDAFRLACLDGVAEAHPLDKRLLHRVHRLSPELGRRVFRQGEDGLVSIVLETDGDDGLHLAVWQSRVFAHYFLQQSENLAQMGGDEAFAGVLIFMAFPWQ